MTEKQPYDPDNIFAKIIRGDAPCVKVYEDEAVLAFMDIFPQSEGHTLVTSKKAQATNLFDIEDDELKTLIAAVKKIACAVEKALQPDGVRIVQFNGAPAGQSVFHIHFHVIPVYQERTERPHAAGQPADAETLKELAARISAAL
ncbi:HIT family protein [Amphiplicatus metriothermophilus]|uniref:Histidine triad (HIT) family protein n=1 Tax=Amphiplicatus metriothermophilus TaxID=1519374 RepID=A0A239PPI8_9PROT|nr:HIT family protein [Amphiplicatus metriothermophilus]MBB5518884.1 histidine triad (HIT) family protein [Amphiplicatus metriothermophilus]SNT71963.1 histidine triad (HIT) family protein [Amphiplicatus metriothermophilus]